MTDTYPVYKFPILEEVYNISNHLSQHSNDIYLIDTENLTRFEGIDYGPLYPSSIPSKPSFNIQEDNLTMSWFVQLAWTSVFIVMILTAIGGNCIVIWIVIAHRRMRTITNYFLVNLSTADLLLSTLNCSFNFVYMLQGNWQFGNWYCKANNFIANITVAASVFTLTGISCDRYLAIVYPLKPRMSKASSLITITFIWMTSIIIAVPCLLYSTIITYKYRGKERIACILIWPDGQPTDSNMDFVYQVLFLIITYAVPMVLMIGCYAGMGKVLWGSGSIGEITQRQVETIRSKRKVVKMFTFIVSVFGICWLPYHGYFIYTHIDRKVLYSKYVQHVYLGFYWFAMANAMVNPLIYYWMNTRFRQYFQTALCGWQKCILKKAKKDVTSIIGNTYSSKSGMERSFKTNLFRTDRQSQSRRDYPEINKSSVIRIGSVKTTRNNSNRNRSLSTRSAVKVNTLKRSASA